MRVNFVVKHDAEHYLICHLRIVPFGKVSGTNAKTKYYDVKKNYRMHFLEIVLNISSISCNLYETESSCSYQPKETSYQFKSQYFQKHKRTHRHKIRMSMTTAGLPFNMKSDTECDAWLL